MKNIIGVRFKKLGKVYYFDPKGLRIRKGDKVIVETENGDEYGEVIISNRQIEDEKQLAAFKKVLRFASYKDHKQYEECRKKEKAAFTLCEKKIKEHKLNMSLTDVEYKFDNSKMIFSFTSDGRVDFRELVKDLAAVYKVRIELRQIGVRDEVKRIGGNGICGRELCCCSFLNDFEAVSIKMAKEQNLSLNPTKISGNCGRLMCCLKYENEVYEEKSSRLPKVGEIVKTEDGNGEVDSVETLKEIVKVKLKDGEGFFYKKYKLEEIQLVNSCEKNCAKGCAEKCKVKEKLDRNNKNLNQTKNKN